jgi:hypothetical protein
MSRKNHPISKTQIKKKALAIQPDKSYHIAFLGGKNDNHPWFSTAKGAVYP